MRRAALSIALVLFGLVSPAGSEIGEIDVNVPARETAMAAPAPQDRSALWVRSEERVFLMIVDPQGRRTGVEAKSRQTLQEIPDSACDADFNANRYTGDIDSLNERITLEPARPGVYEFRLQGLQPGPYYITLAGQGTGGSSLPSQNLDGLISEGEQKVFHLNFQPQRGQALKLVEAALPHAGPSGPKR